MYRYAEKAPGLMISLYQSDLNRTDAQDGDIAKDRFERLVQDVAHLVLEILSSHKRIQQIFPEHALERDNLSTGSANGRVDVERFPQVIDRVRSRLRSNIEQDTHADCQLTEEDDGDQFISLRPQTGAKSTVCQYTSRKSSLLSLT